MKLKYFGDSFDAVKRMWSDLLRDWAPIYADPKYIPPALQDDFTLLTNIPMAETCLQKPHSILKDPDTGIRFPDKDNGSTGRTHTTVAEIAQSFKCDSVMCVVTFDQSHNRLIGKNPKEQRLDKIMALRDHDVFAFYYVSHAPFLFAVRSNEARQELINLLTQARIPRTRIECEATT